MHMLGTPGLWLNIQIQHEIQINKCLCVKTKQQYRSIKKGNTVSLTYWQSVEQYKYAQEHNFNLIYWILYTKLDHLFPVEII